MRNKFLERVEKVLTEDVRPSLAEHGGDITVLEYDEGILKVRLLGQCSNCPSANLTMESVVKEAVTKRMPEVRDVVLVTGVSDELIDFARQLLQHKGSADS